MTDDADLTEALGIDGEETPADDKPKFYCAGAKRRDERTGKKLCNYKAKRRWYTECPKCGWPFACLKIESGKSSERRITAGQETMDKVKPLVYRSTGVPDLDKVLGGGVVLERVILVGALRGAGKPLACDTPVPTPAGWTTQGALRAGDWVTGADGVPARILGTTGPMSGRPCFRLRFSDGTSIVADAEHPWSTRTKQDRVLAFSRSEAHREKSRIIRATRTEAQRVARRKPVNRSKGHPGRPRPYMIERNRTMAEKRRAAGALLQPPGPSVRSTAEIAASVYVDIGGKQEVNHSIDNPAPAAYPTADLPVPPYTLGVWLGDGFSSGGAITTADAEVVRRVESDGFVLSLRSDPLNYGVLGLQTRLRQLGLIKNKHIPRQYLRASVEQRIELLRGLMDTDGYANRSGSCIFSVTNKRLFDGFIELIRSLGITVSPRECVKTCTNSKTRAQAISYNAQFTATFAVFHLERKRARQRLMIHPRYRRRYIVAVDPVESVPVCCVQTDRPDGLYVVGEQWIVTHNTSLLLQAADGFARENKMRAYFASGEMTQGGLLDYAKRLGVVNKDLAIYDNPAGIDMDDLFEDVLAFRAKLLVIDSAQTCTVAGKKGDIGKPSMVDAVANMSTSFAQDKGVAILMIGHLEKTGNYGGTEQLQHLVDGLLRMDSIFGAERDRSGKPIDTMVRELCWDGKTRQGFANVKALVELTPSGIRPISVRGMREISKLHLVE